MLQSRQLFNNTTEISIVYKIIWKFAAVLNTVYFDRQDDSKLRRDKYFSQTFAVYLLSA